MDSAFSSRASSRSCLVRWVLSRASAKLIRRAALEIQTEQFDQSKEALDRLVDSCEGYFENASVYSGGRTVKVEKLIRPS